MDSGPVMRRTILMSVVGFLLLVADPVAAREVVVSDLVADGASFAGIEVTVVGELIGDYGARRDGWTWTQLNGDSYAFAPIADGGGLRGSNIGIGVRMPSELAEGLDAPGRYRTVGPIVELTGVWRYHDPVRQGETYLDVTALMVVSAGRPLQEPPGWSVYGVGILLLIIAGVVMWNYAHRRDAVS